MDHSVQFSREGPPLILRPPSDMIAFPAADRPDTVLNLQDLYYKDGVEMKEGGTRAAFPCPG